MTIARKFVFLLSIIFLIAILSSQIVNCQEYQRMDSKMKNDSLISGYIDVDNGRLFYEMAGTGEPMVLVHDGILHRETWNEEFDNFARGHRVIRYDRRGYGRSPKPEKSFSNVDDLHTLFVQLGIDSAILVGMSAGGGLAIDFTLEYPRLVKDLILVGAVVSGFGYTDHMYNRGGHLEQSDLAGEEIYRKFWTEKDPYTILPQNIGARKKVAALLEQNPHNFNEANYNYLKQPRRPALKFLDEIKIPVLIVVGEYDIPDVHAHAGAIQAGIPGAQRIIVRNAAHHVPTEQPEVFINLVRNFLSESKFFKVLDDDGVDDAVKFFEQLRTNNPDAFVFSEQRMNVMGYTLLQSGNVDNAVKLFKLNIEAYPQSANAYDSYAEALLARGDTTLVIENYKKSLELNPSNPNAIRILKDLKAM